MNHILSILLFLLIFSVPAEGNLFAVELEDHMGIKVNVASGSRALSIEKSPGIVSVLTRQELFKSGVRDLASALKKYQE